MLLCALLAGQGGLVRGDTDLWLSPTRHAAVCLTSKVANTAVKGYVQWVVSGPCSMDQKNATTGCIADAFQAAAAERCTGHAVAESISRCSYWADAGMFLKPSVDARLAHGCPLVAAPRQVGYTVVLPLRDPWARLWSGFSDKVQPRLAQKGCHATLPKLPEFQKLGACQRPRAAWHQLFLEAFVNHFRRDSPLNHHFSLQSQQCLSATLSAWLRSAGARLVYAPLERGGLESVARAFGGPPFSELSSRDACEHYNHSVQPSCGKVSTDTVRAALSCLRPDYLALAALNISYASQDSVRAVLDRADHVGPGGGAVTICADGHIYVRKPKSWL